MEQLKEQTERVFNHYKNRLKDTSSTRERKEIRFNCIEYLCSFPKINPFVMAASLIKDGFTILYDDSSISAAENRRKENQVKKLLVRR